MASGWITQSGIVRSVVRCVGAACLGAAVMGAALTPAMARADDQKQTAESGDKIIFRNGTTVTCTVLEETETSVRARVSVAGISTETTYSKSEILEIKRGIAAPATTKPAGTNKPVMDSVAPVPAGSLVDVNGKPIPTGVTKVYVATFPGEFGREVSKTSVQEFMKDVLRVQPDVLIVKFDHKFIEFGRDKIDFAQVGKDGKVYGQLIKAQELDTLITDRIAGDPAFQTKPRMVAWIHRALGGGAFLPFVFPEIYFHGRGHHGGIGGLDQLFEGVGDEVVRRKQQSLRLAWIVGLCQKGGHDARIVRAMAWSTYILSYKLEGGRVEWLEDKMPDGPEWALIKDDGASADERRDSMEDVVRMKGNDFLTLDANTAEIIGFSRGTADTVDDLLYKMGITRNYALVKNRSKEIFDDWGKEVTDAEKEFGRLWRKFNDVEVRAPGGYPERTAARAQRKRILQEIEFMLKKFGESIDPSAIQGAPERWASEIRFMIAQIETDQRLDKP